MINAIGIALTGLNAASLQLNASAANIANAGTTGSLNDPSNTPYTPQTVQSKSLDNGGTLATKTDKSPAFVPAYAPDSPYADENGLIGAPNVDYAEEIIKMKLAEISYKANLSTIKAAKNMFSELLNAVDKQA